MHYLSSPDGSDGKRKQYGDQYAMEENGAPSNGRKFNAEANEPKSPSDRRRGPYVGRVDVGVASACGRDLH